MDDKNFAFEQVGCEYPGVRERVRDWAGDTTRWRVEWDDGSSRMTSIAGLAYYAERHDDEAEVAPLD